MSLKKYFWIYLGIYIAISILIMVISAFIEIGNGPGIMVPFIAAMTTGQYFVKDHFRIPDAAEKKRLVWGSLAISWGASIIVAVIFVALQAIVGDLSSLKQMVSSGGFMLIMLLILAVVFLISYAMTSWAYGGLLNKLAAKINNKANP